MKEKYVYVVRQTQTDENLVCFPIAVFDNAKDANKLARELNKHYGFNCVFDEEWDFVDENICGNVHYYDVNQMKVNPDINMFLGG